VIIVRRVIALIAICLQEAPNNEYTGQHKEPIASVCRYKKSRTQRGSRRLRPLFAIPFVSHPRLSAVYTYPYNTPLISGPSGYALHLALDQKVAAPHGGSHVVVAQAFLDRPDVVATLRRVSCQRMTEPVTTDPFGQPAAQRHLLLHAQRASHPLDAGPAGRLLGSSTCVFAGVAASDRSYGTRHLQPETATEPQRTLPASDGCPRWVDSTTHPGRN